MSDPDEPEDATPTPTTAPGPEVDLGTGNDPYTGDGARQVPGPYMELSPPPDSPVSAVVAKPVDPDEHVAARNPDGVVAGPVPDPKVIELDPPERESSDHEQDDDDANDRLGVDDGDGGPSPDECVDVPL